MHKLLSSPQISVKAAQMNHQVKITCKVHVPLAYVPVDG